LIDLKQDGIPLAPPTEHLIMPGQVAKWQAIIADRGYAVDEKNT
jgi:hypothetical protein